MSAQSLAGEEKRQHFVFVHGACHGAWVWRTSKVVSVLKNAGHKVSAVDLAGAGDNPLEADDLTSCEEYNQTLVDLFTNSISSDEKV